MKTEMDKDRTARGIRGVQAAPAWFCAATARVRSCAATAATAALMLLAAACTEEPLPDRGGVPDGGGVAVTLNLTPEALSLPAAENAAANAAAADDGGAVSVRLAAPAETPATRAVSDLTVENVWILQFDGTAAGSKLILKRYVEGYVSGTAVSLLPGASQRVVVLANSYDAALCDGLRLYEATYADVQAMEGPAPDALNANPCIPMSGTATLTVAAGASFSVSLKGIVAKVIFQVKVGRGMPTAGWEIQPLDLAPAYWMPDTGSGVWPAAEKLKGDALTAKTGVTLPVSDYATYTWYLPVNRRGSVSGTTAALRRTNAPAGATYIKLSNETPSGNVLSRNYYIHLGANFTNDYNLRGHTQYSYLTTLQAVAGDDSRVELIVKVQANCGMVTSGAEAVFDVGDRIAKAVAADPATTISWTRGADYVPLVIWQDVEGLISGINYDKANGLVTVGTDAEAGAAGGNALVGLFPAGTTDPAAGTCIWSWHVWVTDYKPDGTKSYSLGENSKADVPGGEVHTYGSAYISRNPGKVMMDRNLGATAALYDLATTNTENYPTYGLRYQWGRPTPIPKAPAGTVASGNATAQATYDIAGSATKYPKRVSGAVTVLQAIQNPHILYYVGGSLRDWNSSPNDALWGDGSVKSVYDPCPEGWRIAPNHTWDDFGTNWGTPFSKNAGWTTTNVNLAGGLYVGGAVKAFYPVPGQSTHQGTWNDVGYIAYIWSSTVNGGGVDCFYYKPIGITPNEPNGRTYGCQVRCIQE